MADAATVDALREGLTRLLAQAADALGCVRAFAGVAPAPGVVMRDGSSGSLFLGVAEPEAPSGVGEIDRIRTHLRSVGQMVHAGTVPDASFAIGTITEQGAHAWLKVLQDLSAEVGLASGAFCIAPIGTEWMALASWR